MRAAIFVGTPELSVEDVTPLDPGPRDVVVRIGASGVCHSDLSATNGTLPMPPPCILGHEGSGTVEWVGPEVSRVAVGDRVVASFVPACGSCFFCLHGQSNLCDLGGSINFLPEGDSSRRQHLHRVHRARHVRRPDDRARSVRGAGGH